MIVCITTLARAQLFGHFQARASYTIYVAFLSTGRERRLIYIVSQLQRSYEEEDPAYCLISDVSPSVPLHEARELLYAVSLKPNDIAS